MFTGLVQGRGQIIARRERGGDLRIVIDARSLGDVVLANGESVCVDGICLTATEINGPSFAADVSNETIGTTTIGAVRPGDMVNLERSLAFGQALGGHLVTGHVDGVGEISALHEDGRCWRMRVELPAQLLPYIAVKGSICVQGVSLTVNEVDERGFGVNIVPHTMEVTSLGAARVGTRVNIEVDIIARYLERLLTQRKTSPGDISAKLLAQLGFGKGQL